MPRVFSATPGTTTAASVSSPITQHVAPSCSACLMAAAIVMFSSLLASATSRRGQRDKTPLDRRIGGVIFRPTPHSAVRTYTSHVLPVQCASRYSVYVRLDNTVTCTAGGIFPRHSIPSRPNQPRINRVFPSTAITIVASRAGRISLESFQGQHPSRPNQPI